MINNINALLSECLRLPLHTAHNLEEYPSIPSTMFTPRPPSPHCHSTCETLSVLKDQESTHYGPSNYLHGAVLTHHERRQVCQWGFNLVEACGVDRYIAVVAITYFDRFLSSRGSESVRLCLISHREFQLAFIVSQHVNNDVYDSIFRLGISHHAWMLFSSQACLVISLKARQGLNMTPAHVVEMVCKGMYTKEEIIEMELEVLRKLGWRLSGPTPQDFLQCYFELLPSSADKDAAEFVFEDAVAKADMAMLDSSFAFELPSMVALASLAAVFSEMDPDTQIQLDAAHWINRIDFVMNGTMTESAVLQRRVSIDSLEDAGSFRVNERT